MAEGVRRHGAAGMAEGAYLEEHAGDGDHGEATVVELLQLHVRNLRIRLPVEEFRAEPVVANDV